MSSSSSCLARDFSPPLARMESPDAKKKKRRLMVFRAITARANELYRQLSRAIRTRAWRLPERQLPSRFLVRNSNRTD